MNDLHARLEKVLADAAECDLIGNLAADRAKRDMFRGLAEQYKEMAGRIRVEIDARNAKPRGT